MMQAAANEQARGLSLLFLTYNRSDLLEVTVATTVAAVRRLPSLAFEVVISDDGSSEEHRARIRSLGADKVVCADRNHGLSHNHNKGVRACALPYVLSLQDDWEYVGEPSAVQAALDILDADPEVGVVNFIPPTLPIPWTERRLADGTAYIVFDNDGQDRVRGAGYRPYSDRPHIKRRQFVQDLGDYDEALPMTGAELDFQRRVACQARWKIAHLRGDPPFVHLGEERTFNPGLLRARRLERHYRLPVIGPLYRMVRTGARVGRDWVKRFIRGGE